MKVGAGNSGRNGDVGSRLADTLILLHLLQADIPRGCRARDRPRSRFGLVCHLQRNSPASESLRGLSELSVATVHRQLQFTVIAIQPSVTLIRET